MKEIIRIGLEFPVRVVGYDGDGLRFDNGMRIVDFHDQDCCENVYADWVQLEDTGIEDELFKDIIITGNPNLGIVINGKYAVPCYNSQNGYYSSDLSLSVTDINISNFVKDDIY